MSASFYINKLVLKSLKLLILVSAQTVAGLG